MQSDGKRTLVQYLFGNKNGDTRLLLWVNSISFCISVIAVFVLLALRLR